MEFPIGVRVGPGTSVLTRMPLGASSDASARAMPEMPALLAAYVLNPSTPMAATIEPISMMDAPVRK
jgi:hypothetical protein